ncbi:hypothetical protein B0J17DRAFT_706339 [Rhizoctonia solani]|nr:hypothetical protein B0J17DRAFT_706339 [Rhizoctonia solani]
MGCNSSKAFKEKDTTSGVAATSVSPTLVDVRPTPVELSSSTKQENRSPSPPEDPTEKKGKSAKKSSEYSSYYRGRGTQSSPQSNSNTYSAPAMNPVIVPEEGDIVRVEATVEGLMVAVIVEGLVVEETGEAGEAGAVAAKSAGEYQVICIDRFYLTTIAKIVIPANAFEQTNPYRVISLWLFTWGFGFAEYRVRRTLQDVALRRGVLLAWEQTAWHLIKSDAGVQLSAKAVFPISSILVWQLYIANYEMHSQKLQSIHDAPHI